MFNSTFAKAAGSVFGGIFAVYGVVALSTASQANMEVEKHRKVEKDYTKLVSLWQLDLDKSNAKATASEGEAKVQEELVTKLKGELRQKEEEADAVRKKLSEASESLAAKLDTLSAARKASQELHTRIVSGKTKAAAAAEAHKVALAAKDEQMRKLNPLSHPQVKALFGR